MGDGDRTTRAEGTYGGAVGGPYRTSCRCAKREHGRRREKDAIAAVAADLVDAGDVVLLDAGSTTARPARRLRDRTGITVIAAGLNAIALLAEARGVELIVLGGRVRHPGEGVVGPFAEEQLRRLGPDKVFLGADGVTARDLCCPSPEQARLKHVLLHAGRAAYVLADHSKIGAEPFAYWAPLDRPHTPIVDAAVRPDALEPLPGGVVIAEERDQPGVPRRPESASRPGGRGRPKSRDDRRAAAARPRRAGPPRQRSGARPGGGRGVPGHGQRPPWKVTVKPLHEWHWYTTWLPGSWSCLDHA
ncbi:hypothetical protein Arub01_51410 [Actinomadura rubrobrunea]|uniref:DeoR-like transcriptional repressor C-terminal sensor domain-containing protein n=1 Tax=Actinomadura rubrobrunea TaxID=115335 RepID=A0A9W6Q280_9ACTN|nr:hypothetical protein [Actinomadura rubrobrunea]GLW66897.1 hypothetical protein Arub01_51410 [Actinomadura rubrobrunea]